FRIPGKILPVLGFTRLVFSRRGHLKQMEKITGRDPYEWFKQHPITLLRDAFDHRVSEQLLRFAFRIGFDIHHTSHARRYDVSGAEMARKRRRIERCSLDRYPP